VAARYKCLPSHLYSEDWRVIQWATEGFAAEQRQERELQLTLSRERWQVAAFCAYLQGAADKKKFQPWLKELGLSDKRPVKKKKIDLDELVKWAEDTLKKQGETA
jgi:hypothetical protein